MAIDTSAPRQQQASRRLGQGRSAAGSAACRKRVATLARSAQIARRADPPGPLFHRAIWPAIGSCAGSGAVTAADPGPAPVTDAGAGPASVTGAGAGSVTGAGATGGNPGDGASPGTGAGERPGQGPDPGAAGRGTRRGKGADTGTGAATGAGGQDSGPPGVGDDGALSWGPAVFGGGLARLAAAVPGGAADRAAAPRRCFPPSNASPSCPAAGLLAPRRR